MSSSEAARRRRVGRLEVLLVLAPVLFGCLQIYFSKASDLTSWRGGGFGMYSEPHPWASRNVWVEGERDGAPAAVRLYPLDERLVPARRRNTPLRRELDALRYVARDVAGFPSVADLDPLRESLDRLLEAHGDDPVIASLFPRSGTRMVLVEVRIAPDFSGLQSRALTEREL